MTPLLWTTTAILYLLFDLFQRLQAEYIRFTSTASPLYLAPIDNLLWKDPPWVFVTMGLGLLLQIPQRWASLIYLGYFTRWYFSVALYHSDGHTTNFGIGVISGKMGTTNSCRNRCDSNAFVFDSRLPCCAEISGWQLMRLV